MHGRKSFASEETLTRWRERAAYIYDHVINYIFKNFRMRCNQLVDCNREKKGFESIDRSCRMPEDHSVSAPRTPAVRHRIIPIYNERVATQNMDAWQPLVDEHPTNEPLTNGIFFFFFAVINSLFIYLFNIFPVSGVREHAHNTHLLNATTTISNWCSLSVVSQLHTIHFYLTLVRLAGD